MENQKIIKALMPYGASFSFVDEILSIDENNIVGIYTYKAEASFYQDHFPGNPITPGVILLETMAQIGLLGLGMFLVKAHETMNPPKFAFTSSEVDFLKMVLPGEQVRVEAEKIYFRFGKLKIKATMFNAKEEKVCKGELSGIVIKEKRDEG